MDQAVNIYIFLKAFFKLDFPKKNTGSEVMSFFGSSCKYICFWKPFFFSLDFIFFFQNWIFQNDFFQNKIFWKFYYQKSDFPNLAIILLLSCLRLFLCTGMGFLILHGKCVCEKYKILSEYNKYNNCLRTFWWTPTNKFNLFDVTIYTFE